MNFGFTEEQDLLRAEARKFLDQNAPLDEVRKISESSAGYSPEQWRQIAELGWTGLVVPERVSAPRTSSCSSRRRAARSTPRR